MNRIYFAEYKEKTKELRQKYSSMTKEELIETLLDLHEEYQDHIYESMGEDV